jgi:hypothetical protein
LPPYWPNFEYPRLEQMLAAWYVVIDPGGDTAEFEEIQALAQSAEQSTQGEPVSGSKPVRQLFGSVWPFCRHPLPASSPPVPPFEKPPAPPVPVTLVEEKPPEPNVVTKAPPKPPAPPNPPSGLGQSSGQLR